MRMSDWSSDVCSSDLASAHHEGVVADVLRESPQSLTAWLEALPPGPVCALWLDGVGNPHNLGAILRSAAHFGVSAVLLPKHSPLALSGAAARVAEGRSEEQTYELQSLMRKSYAGFCLKKKKEESRNYNTSKRLR